MRKSAYFSDLAFAFFASFLPALCFLRFQTLPLLWATLVSVLFSIGVCLVVGAFFRKKYTKQRLKLAERREAEMLELHLALLTKEQQTDFFLERLPCLLDGFETMNDPPKKVKYAGHVLIECEKQVVHCRFAAAPLSADAALPILSYPTEKESVLVCNALDQNAKNLVAKFPLKVIEGQEVYLRLKEKEALPKHYRSEAAFEKKKKRRFQLWLQKRNANPFLAGGALTLVSSLVSPFPYYYLIMGVSMVFLSAIVRIFGK